MPIRWDEWTAHGNEPRNGSNVQSGAYTSHCSRGGPAFTIDSNWGGRRDFKTSHGWYYQDMRAPDRRVEPIVGSTPQYSWHNKIATTYEARRTGFNFLPLPGPYLPNRGEITRGGQFPRLTDAVGGDAMEEVCETDPNEGGPQGVASGALRVPTDQRGGSFRYNVAQGYQMENPALPVAGRLNCIGRRCGRV